MNTGPAVKNVLKEQYKSSANLNARIALHQRFSTNPKGWYPWYLDQLDQLDLPETCQMLELGCGPGAMWKSTLPQVQEGWRLTLTDFSPGMAKEASAIADPLDRFACASVDAQHIPFPDESFDVVLANHMLYHVPDKARVLSELRRVLRPGGRLYAATNGRRHMTELYALEDQLSRHLSQNTSLPPREMWSLSFSLENGEAMLREYFTSVELRRYEDGLHVTEAQPLVDYVLSMLNHFTSQVDQPAVEEFKREIEAELQRSGAIHITKDTGLFIAVK
jgi:SAM-dependent methyltransferase